MYTNIHTDHGITVIGEWFDSLERSWTLLADYPISAIKDTMVLLMRNNIFKWEDMYFLQLLGTAMGISLHVCWQHYNLPSTKQGQFSQNTEAIYPLRHR